MNLKYFNQLTEADVIELINFCVCLRKETFNEENNEEPIDSVIIRNEEDRVDELGNRYARVLSAGREGNLVLSSYRITDFSMRSDDVGFSPIDYNRELNIFMFKKYGEDYLRDLYDYRITQLNQEIDEIYSFNFGTRS